MDRFIPANGLRLHCIDHSGGEPAMILLPGLTANANSFDGLVQAGLSPRFRVLAVDLRGRGQSDKPETGYSIPDHAGDVIGLMDDLGISDAVMGGHYFGGLLAMYIASRFPGRVQKLLVLDSASGLVSSPQAREMIQPSVGRLGKRFPSWPEYLDFVKKTPFFEDWWEPAIESYYRADVETLEDGSVTPRSRFENILEVLDRLGEVDWNEIASGINQPALLFRAPHGIGGKGSAPLLAEETARATVSAISNCRYSEVP